MIIEQVDHTNVLNPILREKGIRSLLGVPLLVGGARAGRPARRHARPAPVHRRRHARSSSSWPTGSPWPCRPAPPRSSGPRPPCCNAACCPPRCRRPGLRVRRPLRPGRARRGRRRLVRRVRPAVRARVHRGRRRRRPRVDGRGRDGPAAHALRAYALDTEDPAELLGRLDRQVHQFEPDVMATVLCAVRRPVRGADAPVLGRAPAAGGLRRRRTCPPRSSTCPPTCPSGSTPSGRGTSARSRCRRAPPCACTPTAWSSAGALARPSASTGSRRRCSPVRPSRSAPR